MASPTTNTKAAYEAELNAIVKRFGNLEDQTIKGMIDLLRGLRRSIAAEVATTEFKAFQLQQLQQNITNIIDGFQSQLTSQTGKAFVESTRLGAASVVEPLQAAGIQGVFFSPNPAQVNIALDFSARLIQDIVEPMRASINTQLQIAVLGQRSPFEVMKEVTRILGPEAMAKRWGRLNRPEVVTGLAARGEAIVRTEMTRMYNLATHSQQLATAQDFPQLRKRWLATGDNRTRPHHLAAHGQEVPVEKKFKIGSSRLAHPGDPSAPASETVNCRCSLQTIHPDIDIPVLPIDDQVKKEKERRKKE